MRRCALGAIIGLAFGLGGMAAAGAADLRVRSSGDFSPYYSAHGRRAGMLVIYDNQPGVGMRAYWRAPWGHRHYYPATGKRPAIGRLENLSARSHTRHAESYRRSWSNAAAFVPDYPRGRAFDAEPSVPAEPSLK